MKNIIYIIMVVMIISCQPDNSSPNNTVNRSVNDYSKIKIDTIPLRFIKSINRMSQYNNGKWYLYCIYCDDTLSFTHQSGITKIMTYGNLKLKLCSFKIHKDTTELAYCFYYNDTIPCLQNIVGNYPISSVIFKCNDTVPCQFLRSGHFMWDISTNTRLGDPIKPDVVKYIRENTSKLDPWFIAEARRRGIFDSVKYPPNDFWKHSTRMH
jgi:hypothetical protein